MIDEKAIEALLEESRVFPPPPDFTAQATVRSDEIYTRAEADPEAFWAGMAEELHWFRKWDRVLDWNPPNARWFDGGKINAAYNCLDRHLGTPVENKVALHFEGEPGDERTYTYRQLWEEVCKFANVLKGLGVRKGDRVTLYLPMIPELAIACLACARIGAPHSVVFGGFSADSLADRIRDSESRVVVTADGGHRRGHVVQLKSAADDAVKHCPTVEKVVVFERVGAASAPVEMQPGRDLWWHELMAAASPNCPAEEMESEELLYILYTSGSTGKPKGIAHTTAGYLLGVYATTKWVFDLKPEDVYWCTADIGWVTGHSYIIYGPMANGATQVMYEGAPDFPDKDRFWSMIAKYGVTIFYTAPTAIRAFMKWGTEFPARHDLSSLRLLGSVGEPINPEAWMWYREHIGHDRCPIVDTWWQTETGHMLISPLPGVTALKPGSATRPLPGIAADIVDNNGNTVPVGGGYLVIRKPWPGMLRTLYKDPERYQQVYWSRFPGMYFTGDGAKRDADGYFWVLGRVDDVMNVSGHRLSTMEIESALVDHPAVAEAAVIGRVHEIKGQAPVAFCIVKAGIEATPALRDELLQHVGRKIGAIARPDEIIFTAELPKTRSGKIMRRLLRDVAEGRALGDTTTLADPAVVASLRDKYEASES